MININKKKLLGSGATAKIYEAREGTKVYAAKIYTNNDHINLEKIQAMIAHSPKDSVIKIDGLPYNQFAWPTKIIYSDKKIPIGFLMPLIDLKNSFSLDVFYDKVLFNKLKTSNEIALTFRLAIAKNLCSAIVALHKEGHFFIDLKPQNIRVFKGTHAVTLLDCDGFSIKSKSKKYPAELISTDYISPEATKGNLPPKELGVEQDLYALGVILFQLLNNGTHPFQGISNRKLSTNTNDEKAANGLYPHGLLAHSRIKPRPQSIHNCWLKTTRKLFEKSFIGNTKQRPSAQMWAKHFEEILSKKYVVRCSTKPNDLTHLRFKDMNCPECYLLKINAKAKISTNSNKTTKPSAGSSQKSSGQSTKSSYSSATVFWILVAAGFLLFLILGNDSDNDYKSSSIDSESTKSNQATYVDSRTGSQVKNPFSFLNSNVLIQENQDILKKYSNYTAASPNQDLSDLVSQGWDCMEQRRPDYKCAYKYNLEAFKMAHPEGAVNIGIIFERKGDFEQNRIGNDKNALSDFVMAYKWFKLSMKNNNLHSADGELGVIRLVLKTCKIKNDCHYRVNKLKTWLLKDALGAARNNALNPSWKQHKNDFLRDADILEKRIKSYLSEIKTDNKKNKKKLTDTTVTNNQSKKQFEDEYQQKLIDLEQYSSKQDSKDFQSYEEKEAYRLAQEKIKNEHEELQKANGSTVYSSSKNRTQRNDCFNSSGYCFGKLNLKNGDEYYEGEFFNGIAKGKGTYIWAKGTNAGDKYVGAFLNGKMHGYGTYTFANNDSYIGQRRNDKMTEGTYFWGNGQFAGDKYEGSFLNDNKHGYGVYTRANGEQIKGEFKDDKYVGSGSESGALDWLKDTINTSPETVPSSQSSFGN